MKRYSYWLIILAFIFLVTVGASCEDENLADPSETIGSTHSIEDNDIESNEDDNDVVIDDDNENDDNDDSNDENDYDDDDTQDATPPAATLYVSPNGNDDNPGTLEAPLATMLGARDAIRNIKATTGLPDGGITVFFREGLYQIIETVYFDASDSGTETAPIVYASYPGETPTFTGGSYISGSDFMPVDDPAMLARLSPDAQANVLCFDLFAAGFTYDELDYAKDFWEAGNLRDFFAPHYHPSDYNVPRMQVFIDDEALYLARFPNKTEGTFIDNPYSRYFFLTESDVLESGIDWSIEQLTGETCMFKTQTDRIRNWESYDDIIIAGMLGVEYDYGEYLAQEIDPYAMTVTLKASSYTGVMERGRYYFANVFEELDRPGEYYIDKNTGILYLFPTKNMATSTVKISRLEAPFMFHLDGASHITFAGITAELTKASVMRILGGSNCSLVNSTLKNFGLNGLYIGDGVINTFDFAMRMGTNSFDEYVDIIPASVNGRNHSIHNCTFLNTGYTAATVATGNTARREHGGFVFENNLVMHSGLIGSTYQSGLKLNGCGITVKNNSFFYCRGQAISGFIVDTDIVYNEFCDSPSDMAEDTGTIYINYRTLNNGIEIRYNYFHDVPMMQHSGLGYAQRLTGVYYDNNAPFKDFSYNVVYNAPLTSLFIEHAFPATVVGNIVIDVFNPVQSVPTIWMRDFYNGETGREILENDDYALGPHFNSGLYSHELWRTNYPELYEYYEYMLGKDDAYLLMTELRDNLIVHLSRSFSIWSGILPDEMETDPIYGSYGNNHYVESDPGFVNMENYDFQLTQEAAANYGLDWIDMSKIGVQGLPMSKPLRTTDGFYDPWRWVLPTTDPMIQLRYDNDGQYEYGELRRVVSFWRLAAPGVWVWEGEDAMAPEGIAGIQMKAGATYTAYYPGCDTFPPQFLGGTDSETPPDDVLTFTVDPNRDRYDFYTFDLVKR